MRLAVYGGSFDPPHLAHQQAVRLVLESSEVDRVLVIPVYEHAFEKSLAPFEHRLRMCELAMCGSCTVARAADTPGSTLGQGSACDSRVEVSDIEAILPHPNFTLNTLRALQARYPNARLRLVVGADVLRDVSKWHRFDEVCRLAPLLPLGRVGVVCGDAPRPHLPEVSSTEVRQLLRSRPSGTMPRALRTQLLALIPQIVLEYIERYQLYR